METSKYEKDKLLDEVLKALHYHNEREAVIDLTILSVSAKYAEFFEECECLERKYGIEYEEFEKRISNKENEEHFEEEDDFMTWKFAKEGAEFWRKKLRVKKSLKK